MVSLGLNVGRGIKALWQNSTGYVDKIPLVVKCCCKIWDPHCARSFLGYIKSSCVYQVIAIITKKRKNSLGTSYEPCLYEFDY